MNLDAKGLYLTKLQIDRLLDMLPSFAAARAHGGSSSDSPPYPFTYPPQKEAIVPFVEHCTASTSSDGGGGVEKVRVSWGVTFFRTSVYTRDR